MAENYTGEIIMHQRLSQEITWLSDNENPITEVEVEDDFVDIDKEMLVEEARTKENKIKSIRQIVYLANKIVENNDKICSMLDKAIKYIEEL